MVKKVKGHWLGSIDVSQEIVIEVNQERGQWVMSRAGGELLKI